jgi:hypothetical protein
LYLLDVGPQHFEQQELAVLPDRERGDESPADIAFGAEPVPSSDVVPHAIDPESARRLWELSERLLEP